MKSFTKVSFLLLFFSSIIGLTSCLEDRCDGEQIFIEFEPIYAHPDEFRKDQFDYFDNRPLENPGKIYYYNDILIVNERYEGIHLYDNTDPTAPAYQGFISIPGNLDVAIKNDILYADNYVDLVTIDVSDFKNPKFEQRVEEVFNIYNFIEERGYFIYSKETERTRVIDCDSEFFNAPNFRDDGGFWIAAEFDSNAPNASSSSGNIVGQGGSFARFSVIDNHIYVLNDAELKTFDISQATQPEETGSTSVSWGRIETLFPYGDYLFIGGTDGMHIYSRQNPNDPSFVSRFTHARACDPVVVQGTKAYVTLRDGSACQSFTNQLDIVDITNIQNPQLLKTYDMTNPHGLGVVNNDLYICDGDDGLKVFDKSDLLKIDDNKKDHIKDINAYDIIPLKPDHVIVVGDGGLYQYNTEDTDNLIQLSYIPIYEK